MRLNAGMANRQGDVDLRFAQVYAPVNTLAWLYVHYLNVKAVDVAQNQYALKG
jgi:hypothetical protein